MRSPVLRWRALSGTLVPLQTESSESAPDWICQILYAVHNLQAIIAVYRLNSDVERYLSPVSGKRTTMVLPSYSGLFASSVAA